MLKPRISINGWQVVWAILTDENKMKKIKEAEAVKVTLGYLKAKNYVISTAREEKVTLTAEDINEATCEIMLRIEKGLV